MPHPDLRRTLVAPLLAAAVVGAVLTGCGGQGSGTSCGVDGCTVTFARSGAEMRERSVMTAFASANSQPQDCSARVAGMLAATAAAVFPVMLRATGNEALSLTAYNASAARSSLEVAIRWWLVGIPLVVIYFTTVFRIHRGKAVAAVGREGY